MTWESLTDDDPTAGELDGLSKLLASADEFDAGMVSAVARGDDDGALQTTVAFRVNGTPVGVIVRKNSDEVLVVTDTADDLGRESEPCGHPECADEHGHIDECIHDEKETA